MVRQGDSLWFFIRGSAEFNLFAFNTISTSWILPILTHSYYTNVQGYTEMKHSETFHMVAVSNGVLVTARSCCSMITHFYNTHSRTLTKLEDLLSYSNSDGWADAEYYRTLKFITCEADSLIILGRGLSHILINRLNTPYTASWIALTSQSSFTNAAGWNEIYRYWTLNAICVNNNVYLVGKNQDNLELIKYSVSTNSWTVICSAPCQMCSDSSITGCTSCLAHAHSISTPPSSCECDSGSFRNSIMEHCATCHPTCLECTGPASSHCTACFPNAQLVIPPTSECRCDLRFFLNSTNSCAPCVPRCLQCTGASPNDCYKCEENAGLLANSCECVESYYLSPAGTCQSCHSSCKTCSNALSCINCFSGAQIDNLICVCTIGYFSQPDALNCVPCSASCASCKSINNCDKCGSNAELLNGQCNCYQGFYASIGIVDYRNCPYGCTFCNAEVCEKCLQHWYLYEGNCTQTCPVYTVMQAGRCVDTSPEPFLVVFTNNTLTLKFSEPLTKVIGVGDINIEVTGLEGEYHPTWTIISLEKLPSYTINLYFSESIPGDNSTVTLTFLDPPPSTTSQGTPSLGLPFSLSLPLSLLTCLPRSFSHFHCSSSCCSFARGNCRRCGCVHLWRKSCSGI